MKNKARFKNISKERIKGKTEIDEKIILSPLDHFEIFFFVEIVYFFSETIDAKALKTSLGKTLELFPLICGQLHREPTGSLSIMETTDGVSFTVCDCSTALPEPANDHLSEYDACIFIERLNPFNLTKKNCPLATFKLSRMSGGGSALGISIAHTLADGNGFFNFLNCWSLIHNEEPHTKPFFKRNILDFKKTASRKSFRTDRGLSGQCSGFKYMSSAGLVKSIMSILFKQHSMVTGTIHFTQSQLNAIKNEGSKNGRISLNDALCSHLWKCYADLTGLTGEKKYRLLMPTNIRSKIEHPLAKNYFGNAVSHIIAEQSANKLTENSVTEMALEWRNTVKKVDSTYIEEQMSWLKHHEEQKNLFHVLADIDLFLGDLFITNFSKFPVCNISFNSSKPFRTEIPLIPAPGILFLLPAPENKGINLCTHLPRALTNKLKLNKWRSELYKYGELKI